MQYDIILIFKSEWRIAASIKLLINAVLLYVKLNRLNLKCNHYGHEPNRNLHSNEMQIEIPTFFLRRLRVFFRYFEYKMQL